MYSNKYRYMRTSLLGKFTNNNSMDVTTLIPTAFHLIDELLKANSNVDYDFFLEGISFNVCVDQLDFEVGFGDYSDNDDDLLLGDRIEDGGNKTGAGVEDAMYRKKQKGSQQLDYN